MIAASLGYGTVGLRLLGCPSAPNWAENWSRGFVLGMGTLGWLLFWIGIMGWLASWMLWTLLILGWISLWWGRGELQLPSVSNFNLKTTLLILGLIVSVTFDFLEALAPPADADTLTYHFALPKHFLTEGRIEFVPLAAQGAIPLLIHMTYLVSLGLGGELTLTLWTFTCQLFTTLAIFGIGRRWLSSNWSLALALVFLTTPAVIFGGGSGHMEVRTALFFLIGAESVAEGVKTQKISLIVLAGLMAGFFMASKYYGLFAATGLGVVVLLQPRFFRSILIFAVVALLSGSQWYGWNWWHTGMPVFPTMFHFMGTPETPYWNEMVHQAFQKDFLGFVCVPANLPWLLWYPFAATLFPEFCFGAERTGLGPYLWLLLPGIIAGFWYFRHRWKNSTLLLMTIPAVAYYILWFLIPSNQMTRHLLPLYPLLLIGATVIVKSLKKDSGVLLLHFSVMFCILSGLCIHSLFTLNYLRFHMNGESRDEFLTRNIGYYKVVQWLNVNLSKEDRVLNPIRYLNYLIEVPYFYLNPNQQSLVEIHDKAIFSKFLRQLKEQKITHLIVSPSIEKWEFDQNNLMSKLIHSQMTHSLVSIETATYHSRTLGKPSPTSAGVIKVINDQESKSYDN